jgi:hypothetical protein
MNDPRAKLRRRCDLLFYATALLLAMFVLIVPPEVEWSKYVAGACWFAMVALLVIPRW